jgi:hypothetical protein
MQVYDSSLGMMFSPNAEDCVWIADKLIQANLDIWGSYLPPSPDVYFGTVYLMMMAGI